MNNRLLYFFIFLSGMVINGVCQAQETESSLTVNPKLRNIKYLKSALADTLEIPFFDDFSNEGPLPRSSHWTDNHVYINQHFEVDPISTGVATFDGLNNQGLIYPGPDNVPYVADYLTSRPINLEGKSNITLSFFYQPQGLGTKPESGDSLVLEFKTENEDTSFYSPVWSVDGSAVQPFERVYVPVDGEYLYNGFQFRFKNYVSIGTNDNVNGLGGNTDYWNLDYVLLNSNIVRNDTLLDDVCFVEPIPEILKTYRTIPWKHFETARLIELEPTLDLEVMSYNENERQANINYRFFEKNNPSNTNSYNYNPFDLEVQDVIVIRGDIDFSFTSQHEQKGLFGVECHFLNINPDANRVLNDTLKKDFYFLDYYAYDDGTPEAGYGFQGIGSENSMFAMKFNTFEADMLQAVYIYFNITKDSSNHFKNFKLMVWDVANDGAPGEVLWESQEWSNSLTDEFIRYELDPGITVQDEFFIGWQQLRQSQGTDLFLNIGLDKNTSNGGNAFISTNGIWIQSAISGVVMIRPSFDNKIPVSIDGLEVVDDSKFLIYPNPANGQITISNSTNDRSWSTQTVEIISLQGQTLKTHQLRSEKETIPLDLKRGVYIIRILEDNIPVYSGKMVVK